MQDMSSRVAEEQEDEVSIISFMIGIQYSTWRNICCGLAYKAFAEGILIVTEQVL